MKGGLPLADKRKWMLPLGGAAAVLLTLWGIYGGGTAGRLLPEKEPVSAAPVEVLPVKEEEVSLKYEAALHRRGKPLQDPFHSDALAEAGKSVPSSAIGKVDQSKAFSLETGKEASKKQNRSYSGMPVLKGIMAYRSDRRAILELDGTSMVVREGEQAGLWKVSEIQERGITLISGGNTLQLSM